MTLAIQLIIISIYVYIGFLLMTLALNVDLKYIDKGQKDIRFQEDVYGLILIWPFMLLMLLIFWPMIPEITRGFWGFWKNDD